MSLQYLKKEMRYKVAFLHVDKHQSFYFNTLGTKVSCKVILSLLMDIMKHSHSNQSNKFVTIIVSLLILGKNTKKLQLYCLEINTIIFFDKPQQNCWVFLHRYQKHYVYPVRKLLKIYSNISRNITLVI